MKKRKPDNTMILLNGIIKPELFMTPQNQRKSNINMSNSGLGIYILVDEKRDFEQ